MHQTKWHRLMSYLTRLCRAPTPIIVWLLAAMLLTTGASATPKVILIALDGATPRLINQYLASGVLRCDEGIGLLQSLGARALHNINISPSPTAPGHIAVATIMAYREG
jgi:hypothetical protein